MAINLLALHYPQQFEEFCKDLLAAEIPGFETFSGPEEGIDGYHSESQTIFQFYFPERTIRREKVKQDLEKASRYPRGCQTWILLIPKDPPIRFNRWLLEEQNKLYSFTILVWGRTQIVKILRKYPDVEESYFPSKGIRISKQVADTITNISGPTTINPPKGKRTTVIVPLPPDAISEAQLREIDRVAVQIMKESGGKTSVGFIKKRIKQDRSLTTIRHLSQKDYPDVLRYLRRFTFNQRKSESPSFESKRLNRQAHAKAKNIGWDHDRLSDECKKWYSRSLSNLSLDLWRDLIRKLTELEEQRY